MRRIVVTIAARKALAQRKRHLRKARGGGKVRGESVFGDRHGEEIGGIGAVLGDAPSPEFQAMMAEECEQMLARLDDDTLRQVALRKLEGYTNQEIAELLGRTSRTVERWVASIRASGKVRNDSRSTNCRQASQRVRTGPRRAVV